MSAPKIKIGLEMLRDARDGAFDASTSILNKLLANIQKSPEEQKYRKIKASNPKIAEMLAVQGIKAILTGAGFVQEGEFFTLPADANLDCVAAALEGLAAQAADRQGADTARKEAEAAKRQEQDKENEEERKRMKMGIKDVSSRTLPNSFLQPVCPQLPAFSSNAFAHNCPLFLTI